MGFIEDQNVDLTHLNESIEQALVENLPCADDHHALGCRQSEATTPTLIHHHARRRRLGSIPIGEE
jgi:hypothetical protein